MRNGENFITELRLKEGRMDVYSLTSGINYEILKSQEEERIYHFAVDTISLKVSDVLKDSSLEEMMKRVVELKG
jgi:hypothetical protein